MDTWAWLITPATVVAATIVSAILNRRWLTKAVDTVKKDLSKLTETVSEVIGYINAKEGVGIKSITAIGVKTATSSSPITLSEEGKLLSEKIKAESLVDKYFDRILLSEDDDALAIQDKCFSFAFNNIREVADASERKVIRDAIYNAGGNIQEVLIVYGILFRDKAFRDRGIEVPTSETSTP